MYVYSRAVNIYIYIYIQYFSRSPSSEGYLLFEQREQHRGFTRIIVRCVQSRVFMEQKTKFFIDFVFVLSRRLNRNPSNRIYRYDIKYDLRNPLTINKIFANIFIYYIYFYY